MGVGIFECGCLRCLLGLGFSRGGRGSGWASELPFLVGVPASVGVGM